MDVALIAIHPPVNHQSVGPSKQCSAPSSSKPSAHKSTGLNNSKTPKQKRLPALRREEKEKEKKKEKKEEKKKEKRRRPKHTKGIYIFLFLI